MQLVEQFQPTGSIWANWVHHARRWRVEPIEVYRGPWTQGEGLNRTAEPILLVSNTFDPVTPIDAAVDTQRRCGESASLLIQNGFGHCSLAQPSKCIAKHIRRYFTDGILPANGTKCESDQGDLAVLRRAILTLQTPCFLQHTNHICKMKRTGS